MFNTRKFFREIDNRPSKCDHHQQQQTYNHLCRNHRNNGGDGGDGDGDDDDDDDGDDGDDDDDDDDGDDDDDDGGDDGDDGDDDNNKTTFKKIPKCHPIVLGSNV